MRPKVSIVVPIYNVESYLRRCLDSLLSQTLIEIEIIAINDGSTDSSGKILQEYSVKDNRLKVIDKPNSGVSSARNHGIRFATGDYIGFVDSDDWINVKMYEEMYNAALKEDADIVMCTYVREFGSHSKVKNFNLPEKVQYDKEELNAKILRRLVGPLNEEVANPEFLDAWGTVWSKIYRTEMLIENNLLFTDLMEIGTNEDSLFNIEAFYYAKSFVFLNSPYYHYWRNNSSSVSAGYNPNLIDQWFNLYGRISEFIENKSMNKDYYKALNNRICLNTLGLGLNTISTANNSPPFLKLRKISHILNDQRIKRSFKQLELSEFSIVWRAFYFCAKMRFAGGLYFMLLAIQQLRKIVR
ncbi:glycosyltransferase [Bacillus canaveralius]|uniref:glycosyltransferase n=1 Tax=Bacillus canaveralius TaxID=1403243 RepID=UPI000F77DACB|nr:glycosyltransferase [Bacillus canaveralius]RSK53478.1 glycosyltransferase [Bacillus canaveralius]